MRRGVVAVVVLACAAAAGQDIVERTLVDAGNLSRLSMVLERATAGEPITVGAIGGSITAGRYLASGRPYVTRFADRLAARYGCPVTVANAGIGSTGAYYGAHRVGRDLLPAAPDIVIVDYAVNDLPEPLALEAYEGLVRRLLSQPQRPAVILLFQCRASGWSAQSGQEPIGRRYSLPMVTFRALVPDYATELLPDDLHPNEDGHEWIATFLEHVVDVAESAEPETEPDMPPPLYSDVFEHACLVPVGERVYGSALGVVFTFRPGGGPLAVTVDGVEQSSVSTAAQWNYRYPGSALAWRGDCAWHTVALGEAAEAICAAGRYADADLDGSIDAADMQAVVNGALGGSPADVDGNGRTDAWDVQIVVNATLDQ